MTEELLIADGAVQYVPHIKENPSETASGSDGFPPAEREVPQEQYVLPRSNGTTTVIRPGVSMGVTSGGYTDILVQAGGILSVRSSGVVSDITVQPGGIIASASSSYDPGLIHKGSSTAFISELSGGAVTGIVSGLEFGTYSLPDSPFMQYGVLYIASGGRAVDVNVLSGGTLKILSGGSASSVTVRGIVSFYKGAAGSNIQLTSGGTVAFTSKAYLYGRNSGGSIGSIDREGSVHNLSSVLIGCSGQNDEVLTVEGSASDLTISGGIPVYMSSYEYPVRVDIAENTLVNNLTVDRLGYVNVSSGAVVSNVNLLSSGVLNVLSGGTASVIFDPWNQTRAHAEEGAVVINQRDYNVYIGTYKLLSRTNEVLDGLTISSGSSALIYEGGRVVSSLVDSGGILTVYNGGSIHDVSINSSGSVCISSGGVLSGATINSSGHLSVISGGTASQVVISSGGYLTTLRNSLCHNTSSSAALIGGVRTDGALINVSGLTAQVRNSVVIADSAVDVTVWARNDINRASMTYLENTRAANTVLYYADLTVSSGALISDTEVLHGKVYLQSGAVAEGMTLSGGSGSSDYGAVYVSSGAILQEAVLSSGGSVCISSGGVLSGATVNFSGHLSVISGGTASQVVISSGGFLTTLRNSLCHNTSASAALIGGVRADGALINVSGLTAQVRNSVVIADSAVDVTVWARNDINRASMTYLENTRAANTVLYYADLTVSSGALISDTEVLHGKVYLQSGAVAEGMTLSGGSGSSNYGAVYISSGAILQDAVLHYGGRVYVSSGGTASDLTIHSSSHIYGNGFQITHNGSSAAEVSITADGTFSYVSGTVIANWYDSSFICITGSAYNNIFGALTKISVSGNAFVSGMILNSSAAVTASGGTLVGVTFNNKGSAAIFSGALLSSSTVNSGGLLRVQNGGSAKDITLHSSGVVHVSGGGFLSGATINSSGHLSVISGGTASQVVISSGGYLTTLRNSICHNTSASAALIGGVRADGALINVSGLRAQVRNSVVIADSAVDVTVWAYNAINRASMTYLENTRAANTVLYYADLTVSSGALISDTEVLHGKVYLQSGAVAEGMTLSGGSSSSDYGAVYVSSGAILQEAVLSSGGSVCISSGGVLSGATVNSSGHLSVISGGTASQVVISSGGYLTTLRNSICHNTSASAALIGGVRADGALINVSGLRAQVRNSVVIADSAVDVTVWAINSINRATMTYLENTRAANTVLYCADLTVSSGSLISDTEVSSGKVYLQSGVRAEGMTLSGGSGSSDYGAVYVSSGASLQEAVLHLGGSAFVTEGGVMAETSLCGGTLVISSGGIHRGSLEIVSKGKVSVSEGGRIDFTLDGRSAETDHLINDLSRISGSVSYTVTVSAGQTTGKYKLAAGAGAFTGTVSVVCEEVGYGTLSVNGETLTVRDKNYTLLLEEGSLLLDITAGPELTGDRNGIVFENISETTKKIEISRDGFETALQLQSTGEAVDIYGLPEGNYDWRVQQRETWLNGPVISVPENELPSPQYCISDNDGDTDLFFAAANGIWKKGYAAQHLGSDIWEGTGEQLLLAGKNKLADIFEGSADANILVLTDDANGDALFVDDIYTALGGQARFSRIDGIRAGAGDDIVDMTSERYAYTGAEITIYGGSGNDTIWGGAESNILFGDAGSDRLVGGSGDDVIAGGSGNDSMHGGGGDDIFTFGGNWGNDTVEQLEGGSVTLWFETGAEENWNADTLTYSDGSNSVRVSGGVNVTLKFGDTGSAVAGAFLDSASEKIFEDKSKGFIA